MKTQKQLRRLMAIVLVLVMSCGTALAAGGYNPKEVARFVEEKGGNKKEQKGTKKDKKWTKKNKREQNYNCIRKYICYNVNIMTHEMVHLYCRDNDIKR